MGGLVFWGVAQWAQSFVLAEVEQQLGKATTKRLNKKYTLQVRFVCSVMPVFNGLTAVQKFFVLLITASTVYSSLRLERKLGLPVMARILNWALLGKCQRQFGHDHS